ncbi:hypothetical protein [Geoglobus ahangari]
MTDFRPLRITFRMASPVCLTYPWIHFDAILAHLMQRKLDSHGYRSLPSKRVVKVTGKSILPLKKTAGIYHASVSFFDVSEAYTTTIYKRFCEKHLDLRRIRRKKIDRARGHFRDYMISLVYVPAKRVTFYANGNPDRIESLLEGLPGLGKKVAIGFGFIKDFRIHESDEDHSIVKDGRAMRPIPLPLLEATSEVVAMAYKPPYWAKEFVAPCAPPGAWVKLGENFRENFKLGKALREYGTRVAGVLPPVG